MLQSDGFTITGGKKERKGEGKNSFSGAFGHSAESESTMKDRCRRTFEHEPLQPNYAQTSCSVQLLLLKTLLTHAQGVTCYSKQALNPVCKDIPHTHAKKKRRKKEMHLW